MSFLFWLLYFSQLSDGGKQRLQGGKGAQSCTIAHATTPVVTQNSHFINLLVRTLLSTRTILQNFLCRPFPRGECNCGNSARTNFYSTYKIYIPFVKLSPGNMKSRLPLNSMRSIDSLYRNVAFHRIYIFEKEVERHFPSIVAVTMREPSRLPAFSRTCT